MSVNAPDLAENHTLAARLAEYAELLESQDGDHFRIRAFREAAAAVAATDRPIRQIHAAGGRAALDDLPRIGPGIAAALAEMLETGRWTQLDRLKGEVTPEVLFQTLPGIGPRLAARIVDQAHIETLEELENALATDAKGLEFIGPRRRTALRALLAERLSRIRRSPREAPKPGEGPPVSILLVSDAIYRDRAARGDLPTITPRRFNPEGEAWLPILHRSDGDWHLTALFSNTELAHRLGHTRDWVVIFAQREGGPELRFTVVTETRGPLSGRRVVRGREAECLELLETQVAGQDQRNGKVLGHQ